MHNGIQTLFVGWFLIYRNTVRATDPRTHSHAAKANLGAFRQRKEATEQISYARHSLVSPIHQFHNQIFSLDSAWRVGTKTDARLRVSRDTKWQRISRKVSSSVVFFKQAQSTVYTDGTPPIPTFPTKISADTHCVAGSRHYCLFLFLSEEIFFFYYLTFNQIDFFFPSSACWLVASWWRRQN